jgi:hypothetical protein
MHHVFSIVILQMRNGNCIKKVAQCENKFSHCNVKIGEEKKVYELV